MNNPNFNRYANAVASDSSADFPKFDFVQDVLLLNSDVIPGTELLTFRLNPNLPNRRFYFFDFIAGTGNFHLFNHEFYWNNQLVSTFPTFDRGSGATANQYRLIPASGSTAVGGENSLIHSYISNNTTQLMSALNLYVRADRYVMRCVRLVTQSLSNRLFIGIYSDNRP